MLGTDWITPVFMKIFFALVLGMMPFIVYSQQKEDGVLFYKSPVIYLEKTDSNFKPLSTKAIGKKVYLWVDIVFKKYTIWFTDEEEAQKKMTFKYISEYSLSNENIFGGKSYLVEYQGIQFILIDIIENPIIKSLEIRCKRQTVADEYYKFRIPKVNLG